MRRWPGLVAIGVVAAGCATAPADPPRQIIDLNRQALVDYQRGDLDRARVRLMEAVVLGKESGLQQHPAMARTYLDLGAVYLAQHDRDRAVRHFALALRIQPDIQPAPELASPPIKRAMATARVQVRRHRRGAPAPEPPAPAIAAAPPPTPVAAPAAPAPAAPAPPATSDEPEIPAHLTQAVYCPAPDEAPPREDLALRCAARPGVAVGRMLLYYRPAGTEQFTPVTMVRSRKGWYRGVVPAAAVVGPSLQYYVEAHAGGAGRRATHASGQADSPNVVLVRDASAAAVPPATGAAAEVRETKDDDPLEELERERERTTREAYVHRRGPRTLWLGAGAGSGYGWHPQRQLEARTDRFVATGESPGGLLHFLPELGYQLTDHLALSLQARLQVIPESGSGELHAAAPPHSAFAGLLRLHWFMGQGNWQLFASGAVGGGQGFRLVVPPRPDVGLPRSDTIRGGPLVLGPGIGGAYHFDRHFAWTLELRALAGVPDFAIVGELSTGAQVGF